MPGRFLEIPVFLGDCFLCRTLYTVFQKIHPFNFCNNFVGHETSFVIFGRNVAKEICNMQILRYLLLIIRMPSVENQLKCCWCSREQVVFMLNVEDRILVENLYKFKGYSAKN